MKTPLPISTMCATLADIYLDWRNNYLTVAVFAEHNGISEQAACDLIDAGRICQDQRALAYYDMTATA